MSTPSLNLAQLCNLHVALKSRLPLPLETVQRLLVDSLDWSEEASYDWTPVRSQGFTYHQSTGKNVSHVAMMDQTPEWKRLSDTSSVMENDADSKAMQFQNELRDIMQQKYLQSLKSAREHILEQGVEKYECYTVIDAFLHQSEEYLEGMVKDKKWELYSAQLDNHFGIKYDELGQDNSPKNTDIFLHALDAILIEIPRGPTNNILSKRREPESRVAQNALSKTGYIIAGYALDQLNKKQNSGANENSPHMPHQGLRNRLQHIRFRLKLGDHRLGFEYVHSDIGSRIEDFTENPTIQGALFIKDYLHCIFRRYDEDCGMNPQQIIEHIRRFTKVVKQTNLQPDVIESVDYVLMANTYDLEERISSLTELSAHAMSPFLRGMAAYTAGSLVQPTGNSELRNKLIFSAIDCFANKDATRMRVALELLATGQFDYDLEDGRPARTSPSMVFQTEDAEATLQRIINVLRDLSTPTSVLSPTTIKSILQEVYNYLKWRIQLTRKRCTSCDKIHAQGGPQAPSLKPEEKRWVELKAVYSQLEKEQDVAAISVILKESTELVEFALASLCQSEEALDQLVNHDLKLSSSLLSEIESPESVFEMYIGENLIDDLFHKTYNLLNHLNEDHIRPEKAIQVLELYEEKFREQTDLSSQERLTGEFVFNTLAHLRKESKPKQWIEQFPKVSINKSRDIQSNSDGTFKDEQFGYLIMAIAIRNDFYDPGLSGHNSNEEVSKIIDLCMESLPLKESMRYVVAVLHEGIEDLIKRDEKYQDYNDYHETLEKLIGSAEAESDTNSD